MSVDLFCYVALGGEEVKTSLGLLEFERADLFSSKFIIAPVRKASGPFAEIAGEHGLQAKSYFLVHLNEKNSADRIKEVVESIKCHFPPGAALVLLNNDQPI
jgi:hypothetical protein